MPPVSATAVANPIRSTDAIPHARLVGRGTFCNVFQVRKENGQRYALKRLRSEFDQHRDARRMFAREIHVTQTVRSRYVVRGYYGDADCEHPSLLLEWLDGQTLEQMLKPEVRLPIPQAVWIARQCAEGLADLERIGYSHGDIKPANICVLPDGAVKLIDLGFARPLEPDPTTPPSELLMGTADYMPPELLSRDLSQPIAGDIYSLGVTLFRMLTGQLPFAAETTADVLRLQREAKPPLLRRWRPDAPRELADLVSRMLAKHPLRRPEGLATVIRELIGIELETLSLAE